MDEDSLPAETELELTFVVPSMDLLGDPLSQNNNLLILDEAYWYKDLKRWIQLIQSDTTTNCPEIVRQCSCLSMGLEFTDDLTIKQLNKTWRNKEEVTDVLSFPVVDNHLLMPVNQPVELGDIVISIQAATRQAKEMDHDLLFELRWLVSHGLLHLLGWDHPNQNALKKMLGFQNQLISNEWKSSAMVESKG
tara:strand:- start:2365 stop:2940 length:576 start_codon:yes stop_codon:yes gene_type:complete